MESNIVYSILLFGFINNFFQDLSQQWMFFF